MKKLKSMLKVDFRRMFTTPLVSDIMISEVDRQAYMTPLQVMRFSLRCFRQDCLYF